MGSLTPFPYQLDGAKTMALNSRIYNADQPGLGKTLQALLALDLLGKPTAAVLCPAIARTMWRQAADEAGVPLAFVESYDMYVRNVGARERLKRLVPSVLILDEAHMLSSLDSSRTFEILGPQGPVRQAAVVWPLSGTPMRSGPAGVFPVLAACWPEILRARDIRSYRQYLDRYVSWYEHPRWGIQIRNVIKNEKDFNALWNQVAFRRLIGDVLPQLPPMTWEELLLDATEPTAELQALDAYEKECELRDELVERLAGGELPDQQQRGRTSLLRRLVGEAKAPLSARIIKEDLEGGTDKVFVSAYHHSVLDVLQRELAAYGVVRVDGQTSERDRENARVRFQTANNLRVYLGQIEATQMSVTLTAAAVVHMVEPTWVPDDNEQSARRVYRIGQKRPVIIRMHALADSLDQAVSRVLIAKQRVNAMALDERVIAVPTERNIRVI